MTIIERRRFRQNHLRKELLRKMSAAVPCDPFQYVTDAAYAGLHQKYPDKDAALPAIERLEDELLLLQTGENAVTFYLLHQYLCEKRKLRPYQFRLASTLNDSFIAYLMGLSEVNPFGYKIAPEWCYGLHGEQVILPEIQISSKARQHSLQDIQALPGVSSAAETLSDYKIGLYPDVGFEFPAIDDEHRRKCEWEHPTFLYWNIHGSHGIDLLLLLEKSIGMPVKEIPLDDEPTLEHLMKHHYHESSQRYDVSKASIEEENKCFSHLVGLLKPKNFYELAKIEALMRDTFEDRNLLFETIRRGIWNIDNIIATSDDAFDFLKAYGFEDDIAFSLAKHIKTGICRKPLPCFQGVHGNAFDEMQKNIRYLFPRGHIIASMLLTWRLNYYAVHFPDTYQKCCEQIRRITQGQ